MESLSVEERIVDIVKVSVVVHSDMVRGSHVGNRLHTLLVNSDWELMLGGEGRCHLIELAPNTSLNLGHHFVHRFLLDRGFDYSFLRVRLGLFS